MDDDPIEAECTNESCVNTKNNLKMLMRTTQKQAADLKAYSQISAEADILRMKLYETEKTAQTATAQATEAINGKEIAEAELKQVQSSAEYYRKQIIQLQEEADESHDHKQQANVWREKYDSICALAEKLESNNIDVKAKYESAVQMAKTLAKQLKPLQNQAAKATATAEKNSNMRILNKYLKSAIQVIDALSTTANLAKQPKSVKDQVKIFRRDDVRLHFSSLPWKNSSGRDVPEDSEAADTSVNDDADETEEPPQFESQDNLLQGGRTLTDDEDEVDDEEEEEDDPEIQQLEKDLTEEVVRSTRKTRSQGAVRPDFGPKMRELNARKKAPRIVETKRVKNWPKPLQKPTISGSAQSKHGLLDPRKIHAVHLPVTEFDAISKATEKRKEALLGAAGKPEDAPGASVVASTSGTSIHGRKGKTVREQQSEMMKGESVKEKVARMKALELAKSEKAPNEKPSSSAVVDTFEPDVSLDPVESVNPVKRTETEPQSETISKSPPPPSPPKKTPRMARHQSFCISEGTDSEDEGSRSRRTSVRTPSLRIRSRSVSRSSEAPRRSGRLATKPPTPVKQQPPPVTLRRSTRVASRPVSRAPSRAVSRRSSPSRGATPAAEPQDLIAQAVARNQRARTRSIMRGDGDDEDEDEQPDPKPEEEPKTSPVKRQRSRSRKDSESSNEEEEDLCLTSPFKPQQVVVKEDTVGEVLKQRLQEKSIAATLALARKRAAPAPLDAGPPTRVKGVMGMAAPKKKTISEVKESVHTETDSQDTDEVGEGSQESPEFDEPTTSSAPTTRVAHAVKSAPDSHMVAPTKSPTKQVPQEPPKLPPTTSMLSEASSADEDLRIDDDDDDEEEKEEEDRAPLEKPVEVVVKPVEAVPEAPEAPEVTKPSEPHLEPVKLPEPVKPVSSFHRTLSDLCIPPPASIRAPPTLKSPKQVIASQFGLDISDSEEEEEEEEPAPAAAPEAPKITEVPKEQPVAEKKKPEEKPVERDVDLFSEASFGSEYPDQQLRIDETDDEQPSEQPSTSNVVETEAEFAKPADPVAPKEKETARISKESAKEYSPVVDEEDVAASPQKESPVAKPVAKPVAPKQAPPAIVPKIIIPPERKENLKPRRAPVRSIIPAPVRIPSSQDDTDDDLSLDILAGAKMSKPVPKKPPGTKRPAPPSAVPTTSAVASEPAPKRPAPAKPVARVAGTATKKKTPVTPKPAESKDHEEPDVPEESDTTDPTSSAPTAAGKKSGAILIDARPRGKPRKTDAAPKTIGIKELSVKKSAKALSTARGHLRQALDLKLDVTELKRPLEERGIVLGDSIPLHPSDATDVMMEFLRETSASDMWAVIKKQRSDGNLAPLMNTEEQNFLQVSVSLNSDHKLLLELFIGRILVELCRRDTLDSKQCGRYTRLFCHAVNFAEKDEEQSVEWMRRFVLILLNKHEHQLIKAVAYIMISDVAEHCRWLVEDIDEPSAFAMTFKVFMHLDSEQAAVLNWLLNSKFQYPYIPPPSTEDIKKTFLEAHQKFLTADDVTLEVMKPSIYLSKTGASIVLTVAFEKLKEQMTRLEKQFLEPHEKEKEMRHKTVFSIPSVSTKLTEEEAMAMKREMQWQKFVLMIMVDNQMSNHWKAIISALTEISPKIVDIRELIETPESEQFAEVSAIPAVREAVDQLSQLISEFTNFPLKTSTLATGDSALN